MVTFNNLQPSLRSWPLGTGGRHVISDEEALKDILIHFNNGIMNETSSPQSNIFE